MKLMIELLTESKGETDITNETQAFVKKIEAKYPVQLDLVYFKSRGDLHISRIYIEKEKRSSGIGTAVMEAVCEFADKHGKVITLTPSNEFGGSLTRLGPFYRRFGFQNNKGRKRDYKYSETMYRRPKNEG